MHNVPLPWAKFCLISSKVVWSLPKSLISSSLGYRVPCLIRDHICIGLQAVSYQLVYSCKSTTATYIRGPKLWRDLRAANRKRSLYWRVNMDAHPLYSNKFPCDDRWHLRNSLILRKRREFYYTAFPFCNTVHYLHFLVVSLCKYWGMFRRKRIWRDKVTIKLKNG